MDEPKSTMQVHYYLFAQVDDGEWKVQRDIVFNQPYRFRNLQEVDNCIEECKKLCRDNGCKLNFKTFKETILTVEL